MNSKDRGGVIDSILPPFTQEQIETASKSLLSRLTDERAEFVIDRTIRATLPEMRTREGFCAEDLKAEVVLKLVQRLQNLKPGSADSILGNLESYAAVITYNLCCGYMRSRYPEWSRLKNRIRHTLKHQQELAIWAHGMGAWFCGLSFWRRQKRRRLSPDQASALASDLKLREATRPGSRSARGARLKALLIAIFELAEAPIELGDLVGLTAELCGIDDYATIGMGSFHDCALLEVAGAAALSDVVEARTGLAHLWKEICELPRNERIVLVLSMRDERGLDGLSLLGNAGIASFKEISHALGITALDLSEMWDELPMDDLRIGLLIGLTRQQVSNLRKSARTRLGNRIEGA
jgi:hypothetical protein